VGANRDGQVSGRAGEARADARVSGQIEEGEGDSLRVELGVVISVDEDGGATITPIGCEPSEAAQMIRALAKTFGKASVKGMTRQ